MSRPDLLVELSPGVVEALAIGSLPDVVWKHNDDLCDCEFQRVGQWTNPYIGSTHEIRLCCVWEKLGQAMPDMVRSIPAFFNHNTEEWETKPWEWNGEDEMPKALWYRHLARKLNRPLAEIRAEYSLRDDLRPKGKPAAKHPFLLMQGGMEFWINL